ASSSSAGAVIRYGLVIFGGIDGYSRKIMYLGAAPNNKASTALGFFLESTQNYGFPLRVERLWRDIWMCFNCGHQDFSRNQLLLPNKQRRYINRLRATIDVTGP
ncbi:hypothetical protein CHARACLAT_024579, partial [Characodon lateralis]|nr:hypothetical protein [Characodon lateralis]